MAFRIPIAMEILTGIPYLVVAILSGIMQSKSQGQLCET